MPDGRGARLALEAGFLVAAAAVLVAADLRPGWIVVVMLIAWVIVALIEWVAWREEPHWASGQPPRYYVPEQRLPPRPPSVELPAFSTYPRPAPRETEAATWIATPQMREQVLGWPAPGLEDTEPDGAQLEELSDELLAEAASSGFADDEDAGWPVAAEPLEDPWAAGEPPVEPVAVPEPAPAASPLPDAPAAADAAPRAARHRLDPFAEPPARGWRRRHGEEPEHGVVDLPALPRHVRLEPHETARQER